MTPQLNVTYLRLRERRRGSYPFRPSNCSCSQLVVTIVFFGERSGPPLCISGIKDICSVALNKNEEKLHLSYVLV